MLGYFVSSILVLKYNLISANLMNTFFFYHCRTIDFLLIAVFICGQLEVHLITMYFIIHEIMKTDVLEIFSYDLELDVDNTNFIKIIYNLFRYSYRNHSE